MHFIVIFQSLEQQHPDSAIVLRLLSLFEPENIPIFDSWDRDDLGQILAGEQNEKPPLPLTTSDLFKSACCLCARPTKTKSLPLQSLYGSSLFEEIVKLMKDNAKLNKAFAKP